MTRYTTGNSRPSNTMKDLNDNTLAFDDFINLSEDESTTDRFGVSLDSARKQVKKIAADAVANIKWQQLGEWATGLVISNAAQIVRYSGDWFRYTGTFDHTITGSTPADDGGVWTLDTNDGLWINIGDAALRQELNDGDGYKNIGKCADYATLMLTEPESAGQRILLAEYTAGTGYGGGEFIAMAGTGTEDGGINCVVNTSWYWQRVGDPGKFNVTMFGAVPDAATDCANAVSLMAAWSLAQSNAVNSQLSRIGVKFPAGNFAMSSWSYTTYVSYFKLSGALASFGYFATTKLTLIGEADSWAFTVQARWCEVSGIDIYGQYDQDSVVRNYFKNTVTAGAYFNATIWHASYVGGKCFSLLDTLDTRFSQFYTTHTYDSILYVLMSGSGSWDHSTAIELTNFNIQYHMGDSIDKCGLYLPRCTQSLMKNGWIEHSSYPGNISEGDWTMDRISLEANSNPLYAQYCRLVEIGTNINGTNGIDYDDGEFGSINGVTRPSWATSAYEMGRLKLMSHGTDIQGSLSYKYLNSSNRIANMTSASAWYYIGSVSFPAVGASCKIRLIGTRGFDSATSTATPISTRFGGGEAFIRIQHKDDDGTNKTTVTWHGEESTPITDVKYVQSSTGRVLVYALVGAYTYAAAVLLDTDSTNRYQAGTHFYWTPSLSAVSDITTVDGIRDAYSVKAFSNGVYGFGMEMDNGVMTSVAALQATGAMNFLPWKNNGTLYYIPMATAIGMAYPHYYKSSLPDATTSTYHEIFVIDTAKTPALQKCYSNGTDWVYALYPDTVVA